MRIDDFRKRLVTALGRKLEYATPANVREFVDQMQLDLWREEHPQSAPGETAARIEIPDSLPMSYEALMRSFFVRALDADRDQALIQLWILALDLAYSGIEEMHSEQMQSLFRSEFE
jgi:hypothetical protein